MQDTHLASLAWNGALGIVSARVSAERGRIHRARSATMPHIALLRSRETIRRAVKPPGN